MDEKRIAELEKRIVELEAKYAPTTFGQSLSGYTQPLGNLTNQTQYCPTCGKPHNPFHQAVGYYGR